MNFFYELSISIIENISPDLAMIEDYRRLVIGKGFIKLWCFTGVSVTSFCDLIILWNYDIIFSPDFSKLNYFERLLYSAQTEEL